LSTISRNFLTFSSPAQSAVRFGHTVFNRWSHTDEVMTAVAYLASDAMS
jgi:hypothetical protein